MVYPIWYTIYIHILTTSPNCPDPGSDPRPPSALVSWNSNASWPPLEDPGEILGYILWMEDFLHQLIGDLSHCLKVFNYPRWCKISSTHRTLGGSNPWGCPKNGWFCIGKNLTNVDDFWGTPMTWETSIVDAKANGRNSLVEHTMNISNIRSDFEKLL